MRSSQLTLPVPVKAPESCTLRTGRWISHLVSPHHGATVCLSSAAGVGSVLQQSPDNIWVSHWPQWRTWVYPPNVPYVKCFPNTMTLAMQVGLPTSCPSHWHPGASHLDLPQRLIRVLDSPSAFQKAGLSFAKWQQMDSGWLDLAVLHLLFASRQSLAEVSGLFEPVMRSSACCSICSSPSVGCMVYIKSLSLVWWMCTTCYPAAWDWCSNQVTCCQPCHALTPCQCSCSHHDSGLSLEGSLAWCYWPVRFQSSQSTSQ